MFTTFTCAVSLTAKPTGGNGNTLVPVLCPNAETTVMKIAAHPTSHFLCLSKIPDLLKFVPSAKTLARKDVCSKTSG